MKQNMIPRGLTIAGSDSGGGAGIQADIKTMEALGVFATSVITAITAQNTQGVKAIQKVDPEMVAAQIDAVTEDIGVDAAKTGMLADAAIVEVVAERIGKNEILTVVDPVMVSKSGDPLLEKDAINALKEELLPKAILVTPNIEEAEILSGMRIKTQDDCINAARSIANLGAEAVLVKGGHLDLKIKIKIKIKKEEIIDILYLKGKVYKFPKKRIRTKNTHGTGCTLSAAIAAFLAKGETILKAVEAAEEFMYRVIRYSFSLGRGCGPVHHLAGIRNEAARYDVLSLVREAVEKFFKENISELIPEVGSNFAVALPYALGVEEVAGVEGRIVRVRGGIHAHCPWFGVSSHVARFLLAIREHDPSINAAMNICLTEAIKEACESLFDIVVYDRGAEPREIKAREGGTMEWIASQVMQGRKSAPDVVLDWGEVGKEQMARVLARSSEELVEKILRIHHSIKEV